MKEKGQEILLKNLVKQYLNVEESAIINNLRAQVSFDRSQIIESDYEDV
jgi:hypothetical protein